MHSSFSYYSFVAGHLLEHYNVLGCEGADLLVAECVLATNGHLLNDSIYRVRKENNHRDKSFGTYLLMSNTHIGSHVIPAPFRVVVPIMARIGVDHGLVCWIYETFT